MFIFDRKCASNEPETTKRHFFKLSKYEGRVKKLLLYKALLAFLFPYSNWYFACFQNVNEDRMARTVRTPVVSIVQDLTIVTTQMDHVTRAVNLGIKDVSVLKVSRKTNSNAD